MAGVLVAISIPIFTSQLKKAKAATDLANARSIYSELTADYLDNNKIDSTLDKTTLSGAGTVTITEAGTANSFKFNDTTTSLTITTSTGTEGNKKDTAPVVEITTNGTSYKFPGNTDGTTGE